jgi:PhoPQ-activated pathogenicity-related protein
MKYNTVSCASACADQYFAALSTRAYSQDSFARKTHILSPARLPFHHSSTRVEETQISSFLNRFQSALALTFALARCAGDDRSPLSANA